MNPQQRPRDHIKMSLRYLLLKHKADVSWKQYVDSAYNQMQKTGDRLIESNAYYNMAVEAAATHEFLWVSLMKVHKANESVIQCTTNYENAVAHYQYLMKLHLKQAGSLQ